jgi:CHAD domain-containing protein/transposase-like protein
MLVALSGEERERLVAVRDGASPAARHAQIILLSDENVSAAQIAETVGLSTRQVYYWRRRWQEQRLAIFEEDQPAANTPPAPDADDTPADDAPAPRPGIDVPRLPLELRENEGILPDEPMAEAGRKALLFNFERMLLHEPGSRLGQDIEAVHDMRVATRRMRSALRVFRPFFEPDEIALFRRHLRSIAEVLGEVRDLEVFLDKSRRFAAQHPELDLVLLLDAWQAYLDDARQGLVDELDRKKFARFVKRFHRFLTTPGQGALPLVAGEPIAYRVAHVVPRLIYERYEQVRGYDSIVAGASLPTLHALRIEFKRLRYALEFFEEILGPSARSVIKEVKIMQDHLGELNDTQVAITVLNEFIREIKHHYRGKRRDQRPNLDGVWAYIAHQQAEQQRLYESFPAAWANFNRPDVRQQLALAVAAL